MVSFALTSVIGWLAVVVFAAARRSRAYAVFRGVQLGLHTLFAIALLPSFAGVFPIVVYLHTMVFVQAAVLVRPVLRPLWYRALVSVPAAFFAAGTFLALPWALAASLGWSLPFVWLPYALALVGVVQSLTAREEQVDVVVADGEVEGLRRHARGSERVARPLHIIQITDPH